MRTCKDLWTDPPCPPSFPPWHSPLHLSGLTAQTEMASCISQDDTAIFRMLFDIVIVTLWMLERCRACFVPWCLATECSAPCQAPGIPFDGPALAMCCFQCSVVSCSTTGTLTWEGAVAQWLNIKLTSGSQFQFPILQLEEPDSRLKTSARDPGDSTDSDGPMGLIQCRSALCVFR